MDFPPAITKALKPLGHELVLWREAIILLHGRLAKHRLPPDLGAFVARWLPAAPAPVPDEFEIGVGELANGGLRLQSSSVPFASDPTWWALLQLPALKGHWAADLRTSHHDHLLAILPRAWMMDPAPLPPGAVIPHLNLPGWPEMGDPPGSFTRHSLNGHGQTVLVENLALVQQWRATYVIDREGVRLRDAAPQ